MKRPIEIVDFVRDGNLVYAKLTSQSREGVIHTLFYNIGTGDYLCTCEASFMGNKECPHIKLIKEKLTSQSV